MARKIVKQADFVFNPAKHGEKPNKEPSMTTPGLGVTLKDLHRITQDKMPTFAPIWELEQDVDPYYMDRTELVQYSRYLQNQIETLEAQEQEASRGISEDAKEQAFEAPAEEPGPTSEAKPKDKGPIDDKGTKKQ